MSKSILVQAICLGVLLGSTLVSSAQAEDAMEFPPKMQERLLLPSAANPRERQVNLYQKDNTTLRQSQVEFRDGVSQEINYRKDGSKRDATKYYEGDKKRVRDSAQFAPDGKSFVKHEVFRLDGTLERRGRLMQGGFYEQRYFFEDGKTTQRVRLFDQKKQFISDKLYRQDGTQVAEITITPPADPACGPYCAETHVNLYNEHGVLAATYAFNRMGDARGEVYGPDGIALRMQFVKNSMISQADYYNEEGILVQHQMRAMGATTVDSMDERGIYRQIFRDARNPDGTFKPMLRRVTEWTSRHKLLRTIEMSKDGSHPAWVEYRKGPMIVRKVLGEDGLTIVRVETYNEQGDLQMGLDTHGTAKESFTTARLEYNERSEMPAFTDFGPPRIYDYDTPELVPPPKK